MALGFGGLGDAKTSLKIHKNAAIGNAGTARNLLQEALDFLEGKTGWRDQPFVVGRAVERIEEAQSLLSRAQYHANQALKHVEAGETE